MHLFVISKKLKIKNKCIVSNLFLVSYNLYINQRIFIKVFFVVFLKVLLSKKKMDAKL